jgi:pimeloyl-ACP methyl ester carboxylesterase
MGGAHLFHSAVYNPQHMRALILIDTSFRVPSPKSREPAQNADRGVRIFESEAAALSCFRLMPPQTVREPALVDYVARKALRQIAMPDGRSGWAWRHDPNMLRRLEPGIEQGPFPNGPVPVSIPLFHITGDRSHVTKTASGMPLASDVPWIAIPDCGHHVMMDQPAALVAILRRLLSA